MPTITTTPAGRSGIYRNPGVDSRNGVALLGRVLLASIFVWSGFGKVIGFAATVGYISSKGLPMPAVLAALAVVAELGGGLALLAGWNARWAALLLAIFLVVITPIFHPFWAVPPEQVMAQQGNFSKNVAILGGMLMVFAFGPGRYSVDRR